MTGGWIERRVDEVDRRRIAVTLTAGGSKRLAAFLPEHYRRLERMLSGLSKAERRKLMDLLGSIETTLSSDTPDASK
jgi:DNA-binding MarR family transcriptional regulator